MRRPLLLAAFLCSLSLLFPHGMAGASPQEQGGGPIEADALAKPWPRQRVKEFEVGRWPVRWRESASKRTGIFAGVEFVAPLGRD